MPDVASPFSAQVWPARGPLRCPLLTLVACGGLTGLPGCGDEVAQDGPPEIVGLRFLDSCTLEVTFSEPMARVGEVDADIFRLSAAFYADGYTEYYDLGQHFDGSDIDGETLPQPKDIPAVGPDHADGAGADRDAAGALEQPGPVDSPRHYLAKFIAIELDDDDPAVARLTNALEVDALGACEAIAEADDARLMLHYSDFWEPRMTDRGGAPLEDLGAHWVRSLGMKTEAGRYPFMPLDMPIPCP